jgi:hypothetical protein
MAEKTTLLKRFDDFRPSKGQAFWGCAGCIVATMIIGFTWGGWVTNGTAQAMALKAATGSRAELMAAICVDRFARGTDATANRASLTGTESWKRDDFIKKGGWVTVAGVERPVDGAAELCAKNLLDATLPAPAKTSG